MTTPLRFIPEEAKLWTDSKGRPIAIAEVTVRTVQGRFLFCSLRPPTHALSWECWVEPRPGWTSNSTPMPTSPTMAPFWWAFAAPTTWRG